MRYYSEEDVKDMILRAERWGEHWEKTEPRVKLEDYTGIDLDWNRGNPPEEGRYVVSYKNFDFFGNKKVSQWIMEFRDGKWDCPWFNEVGIKYKVVAWRGPRLDVFEDDEDIEEDEIDGLSS